MLRVYNFETFGNSPYTTESAKQGEQRSMVSSNIRLRPSEERIQTTPPPFPGPNTVYRNIPKIVHRFKF